MSPRIMMNTRLGLDDEVPLVGLNSRSNAGPSRLSKTQASSFTSRGKPEIIAKLDQYLLAQHSYQGRMYHKPTHFLWEAHTHLLTVASQ